MRDLAGRPGLLVVVPNEDFGTGSQSVFHAIGIEQAAHDPAEDVSAIDECQCLAHSANIFYDEALILVRRLLVHAPGPAKYRTRTLLTIRTSVSVSRRFMRVESERLR